MTDEFKDVKFTGISVTDGFYGRCLFRGGDVSGGTEESTPQTSCKW